MSPKDRIMRAIAFYFSVALFCVLLPVILSYALGYKIDYHNLKIYKTGILYVASRPAGATIYLNGVMRKDLTPARIEELRPGNYKVEVCKDGFYPWEKEMTVRPNMVTKEERIVLFSVTQEMKTVSQGDIRDFLVSDDNYIYYMRRSGLFRSDMGGTDVKKLSGYGDWPDGIIGKRFSSDGNKFLFFSKSKLGVVHLQPGGVEVDEVFIGDDPIMDAFWYPGAGYIIAITHEDIKVVELSGAGTRNIVSLYKFNSKPRNVRYDEQSGSLYFIDTRIGEYSAESNYLYRLDLKESFFDNIMQLLVKKEPDNEI
ncbi:MAG: PEGA domain-containing protein [Candidatus Omnitrophota bacterium]